MTNTQEQMIQTILAFVNNEPSEPESGIPLGVSNRHIHLTRESMEILFGSGYELTKIKDLGQPGQFATKETVCIAGKKGSIANVRVLGPVRSRNQVEISRTDAFSLGVNPPVRISGDLDGAADICVIGPKGMMVMKESTIIAKPHIHMTQAEADAYQVKNKEEVSVTLCGDKKYTMHGVEIRISDTAGLELHIDTDEANAAGIRTGTKVEIEK